MPGIKKSIFCGPLVKFLENLRGKEERRDFRNWRVVCVMHHYDGSTYFDAGRKPKCDAYKEFIM